MLEVKPILATECVANIVTELRCRSCKFATLMFGIIAMVLLHYACKVAASVFAYLIITANFGAGLLSIMHGIRHDQ